MSQFRTSRELAARVEQDFHRRPRPYRRWINWLSLAACLAAIAWLGVMAARGRNEIYAAGPVAQVHRMFENDCAKCHEPWKPIERLSPAAGRVTSVDDAKCQACHAGPVHHERQIPAHAEIGCATCHREHRHDETLLRFANDQCIACHGNLVAHGGGPNPKFEPRIERFGPTGAEGRHPEFALHLAQIDDKARIRFNHQKHLAWLADPAKTIRDECSPLAGKERDLAKDCSLCHVPDAAGEYMLPVRFEAHCKQCHPLYFDNVHFPCEQVPHATPAIVRGFLAERYFLRAKERAPAPAVDEPAGPRLPGLAAPIGGGDALAREIRDQVAAAEETMFERERGLLGQGAGGGCRFCHVVERDEADPPRESSASWRIAPTGIPERWLAHSRFSHARHRMMKCDECHRNFFAGPEGTPVEASAATSDVLIPSIAVCRNCHADSPGDLPAAAQAAGLKPARATCVECHSYHHGEAHP